MGARTVMEPGESNKLGAASSIADGGAGPEIRISVRPPPSYKQGVVFILSWVQFFYPVA